MKSLSASSVVEVDQRDAELRGAAGLHVRVVGDHLGTERHEPLGREHADPAEADDADRLLVDLDAGVLRALPLAVLQCGIGGRDVAGGRQQQSTASSAALTMLDGRRVHDHDAGLRCRRDVDVVEPDAGAGDHLQPAAGGQRLGIDLGGAADQHRVRRRRSRAAARRGRRRCSGAPRSRGRGPRRGGRELFGDQNDGFGHGETFESSRAGGSWPPMARRAVSLPGRRGRRHAAAARTAVTAVATTPPAIPRPRSVDD